MVLPSSTRPDHFVQPEETKHIGSSVVETENRTPTKTNSGTAGYDWAENAVYAQCPSGTDYESEFHLGVPGGFKYPVAISFRARFSGDLSTADCYFGLQDDADSNRITFQVKSGQEQIQTQTSGAFSEKSVSGQNWTTYTEFRFEWVDDGNDGNPNIVRFFVGDTQVGYIDSVPDSRMHPVIRARSLETGSSDRAVYLRSMRSWQI